MVEGSAGFRVRAMIGCLSETVEGQGEADEVLLSFLHVCISDAIPPM